MCGIAGIFNVARANPVQEGLLEAMAQAIRHRGPNAQGIWEADGIGLAHRRLSIIDLQDGNQPIGNEDGTVQVVFNGEIYNYRELRNDLLRRGHQFRTQTDTEVLVHLYEDRGVDLVHSLRGMFAFAIYDSMRESLLLARDRIGLKPLYYFHSPQAFLFASELKSILAAPEISREIDLEGLEDYFTFGVVAGHRSIFRQISKLPPASTLCISRGSWKSKTQSYWQLQGTPDEDRTEADWLDAVRSKFDETVQSHTMADVPIGAFLSGGLDSSAVTAAIAQAGHDLTTFSIGFHESEFSELKYARQVARQFGTHHIEEIVTPQAAETLDLLIHHYDEPFADSSAIPSLHLARIASQHVRVVLSGDGGDEAFGGYARYAHDLREDRVRRWLPSSLRSFVLAPVGQVWPKADWLPRFLRAKTAITNLSLESCRAYANTISVCRNPLRRALFHPQLRHSLNGYVPERQVWNAYGIHERDALRGMIAADIHLLLPDDFLTKVDRASMAFGLEVRPPMVDHEFLELTQTIPSRFKVRYGETKSIFKKMCDGWLPPDVVRRPKQGFEIPVDAWLRGPLRDLFESTVLKSDSILADYIDQGLVAKLYQNHLRGSSRLGSVLWSILILGAWMDHYLSSDRVVN